MTDMKTNIVNLVIPKLLIKPSLLVKLGICFLRFFCISSKSTKSENSKNDKLLPQQVLSSINNKYNSQPFNGQR